MKEGFTLSLEERVPTVDGGGWRDVYKVNDREEFFSAYDQSRTLCMTLQRAVNFKEYFRC